MIELDHDEVKIDIHHIFPKDWCVSQNISHRVYNSIINKTPISYKANRMIGGKAPSKYLQQIRQHAQVQISEPDQDAILKTHLIDPAPLRTDDFTGFMAARKAGKAYCGRMKPPHHHCDESRSLNFTIAFADSTRRGQRLHQRCSICPADALRGFFQP